MNHPVVPLNWAKFDILNGLRRLQQHMEQITQQSLTEMLSWTCRQSAAAGRVTWCEKCTIYCNRHSIICEGYEFHPQETSEMLAGPKRPNTESKGLRNRLNGYAVANSFIKLLLNTYYVWDTTLHSKKCFRTWFLLSRARILAEYNEVPKNGAQEQPLQLASAGIWCATPGQPALGCLWRMPLRIFIVLRIVGQVHKTVFLGVMCQQTVKHTATSS